jgi:hypothetical protein
MYNQAHYILCQFTNSSQFEYAVSESKKIEKTIFFYRNTASVGKLFCVCVCAHHGHGRDADGGKYNNFGTFPMQKMFNFNKITLIFGLGNVDRW